MQIKNTFYRCARHIIAFSLIAAPILGSLPGSPTYAEALAPRSADVTIRCDDTPFGRTLVLRHEDEVFVGYQNLNAPNANGLGALRLDVITSTGQLRTVESSPLDTAPADISGLAGVTADLDGDGRSEFVQGFTNGSGQYELLVRKNGGTAQSHLEAWPNHSARAMAAGDVLGRKDGTQQVVVASRDGSAALHVAVFPGAANGIGAPVVQWRSDVNHRVDASDIRVAVGNLDNDRYIDIVVALLQSNREIVGTSTRSVGQLIFLEYQPASGAIPASLQERTMTTFQILDPRTLRMGMADLTGTGQRTVIVAFDHSTDTGLSLSLTVYGFDVVTTNGVPQFALPTDKLVRNMTTSAHYFNMAIGDVSGDHRDDIVLGYDTSKPDANYINIDLVTWAATNNDPPKLTWLDHWQDGNDGRDQTRFLSLAVADLDKDGSAEIIAAFKDASPFGFQMLYLHGGPNQHMQLKDWNRQDPTLIAPVNLVVGDWDNDSLRARLTGKCAQVTDANVTAASFIPPFWANMQGGQDKGGMMGQTTTQGSGTESSLTYNSGSSVSTFMGTGVGFNLFDVIELGASAKFGSTTEYSTRDRLNTGVITTTTTTTGRSWDADAVVYQPATFNCYTYQLSTHDVLLPTDQAELRFCDYQRLATSVTPLQSSELNLWDLDYGRQPEYVPVLRDWASVALFRGRFADQSSNASTAANAVDSEIAHGSFLSGTLAQTGNDAHAWWQVDLGKSQPIGNIRLWTPPLSLSNFYILVSDTDFRAMPGNSDPANLVGRADVKSYTLANLGGGFAMTDTAPSEATFSTLDAMHKPIRGRYVRVQRASAGALTLAEVQVFGTNHVEPDRYPLDACDQATTKTPTKRWCDVTANDGFFKVLLYNPWYTIDSDKYVPIKVRGHILWDGRANPALNSLTATRGNTNNADWSMSNETVQTRVQAHTISNNTRNAAEYEGSGAAIIKVMGGHGTETTTGLDSETIQSTSWGNAFNMGGHVKGFPPEYSGPDNDWSARCKYRMQPYFYETSATSNFGVVRRFPVLDYLVPEEVSGIDLTRGPELGLCRNGNVFSATPKASNDMAQATPDAPLTLNVLANDQGDELTLTDVGPAAHGKVTHTQRSILYTPAQGFSGSDSFTYTIIDAQGQTATGTVTVQVNSGTVVYLPMLQQ